MKTTTKKWLKIGVLGGMGPIATLELYKKILHICQTQYGCVQDYDFPQIFINNVPLDGFTEKGIMDVTIVKERLLAEAKNMQNLADFLIVPCNTLHHFHEEISAHITIKWLSLPQIVVKKIHQPVGLLTSQSTKESALYKSLLLQKNIPLIETSVEQQKILNEIIAKVMACHNTIHDNYALHKIMLEMQAQGAQSILLGCTELPVAYQHNFGSLKVYDSLQILAEQTLKHASC